MKRKVERSEIQGAIMHFVYIGCGMSVDQTCMQLEIGRKDGCVEDFGKLPFKIVGGEK